MIEHPVVRRLASVAALSLLPLGCDTTHDESQGLGGQVIDLRRKPQADVNRIGERHDVRIYYVPAYSHIYMGSGPRPFQLTTTLSLRNASMRDTLGVEAVHYYDSRGNLVYDYVKEPFKLAPLQTFEIVVGEHDTTGGSGASFLVELTVVEHTTAPIIESVMVGASSTVGLSFVSRGVLEPSRTIPGALLR